MIKEIFSAKTLDELNALINKYKDEYPSAGYGTFFETPYWDDMKECWIVIGYRSRSCD